MHQEQAKVFLRALLDKAIAAAAPDQTVAKNLPEKPKGRCFVVGAGKAAAAMARAVERAWPDVDLTGVVVTRYDHQVATDHIVVRQANHPTPDEAGLRAAQEIYSTAQRAGKDDLVLALISGGGSSLMPLPKSPLTLEEKIRVNKLLLRSGLTIEEMNCIRRRLSDIKGGGLAQAVSPKSRLVTLAISDVPGDDPAAIASGPTVADPTAYKDLSELVTRLGPELPETARKILLAPVEPQIFVESDFRLIATPQMSLSSAARFAHSRGITPLILGDRLEGEAAQMGVVLAGIAKSVANNGAPVRPPAVLLSGGETTVTIGQEKPGRGGRNTEFLLSLAHALDGHNAIYALAADTDGIDGTEDAAGAVIHPNLLSDARDRSIDPASFLRGHDSYSFFDQMDCLIKTGPTLTNVNDFRAILIC